MARFILLKHRTHPRIANTRAAILLLSGLAALPPLPSDLSAATSGAPRGLTFPPRAALRAAAKPQASPGQFSEFRLGKVGLALELSPRDELGPESWARALELRVFEIRIRNNGPGLWSFELPKGHSEPEMSHDSGL